MRKIVIAGNWKMNKNSLEAVELVNLLLRDLIDVTAVDIIVCPTFTSLSEVADRLTDTNIALGAQNLYWEDSGAFTGEISGPMLVDLGVKYVIIGHSERRQFFGETDETVSKKIAAALRNKLIPIVCVGENLQEREGGKTWDVLKTQCSGSLRGLTAQQMEGIILAYEPVWAIGTGKTATPAQAQEAHQFIRGLLAPMFGEKTANQVRIQYGGSVKAENARDLLSQPDIDGALVGGASLKSDLFGPIVKNSIGIKK